MKKKEIDLKDFDFQQWQVPMRKPKPIESIIHYLDLHKDEIEDYELNACHKSIELKITLKKESDQ